MEISRDEFYRAIDGIKEELGAIRAHLDTLNGRTGKGEVADAELRQRVTSVEKEVFQSPRRRASDGTDARSSKRDSLVVVLGVAIFGVIVKIALVLGEKTIDAILAALKAAK